MEGRSLALANRFRTHSRDEISVSSVTKAELVYGVYKSRRVAENLRRIQTFLAPLQSYAFDDACVDHYGRIRVELQRQGRPIGGNDLLIAAIALTHSLTLVTANTREFSRVIGLRIENWEIE